MMARKYMHEYFVHVLFIENYEVCETLVYNRGIDLMYRLNRLVFPCITGEGERGRKRETVRETGRI